MFKTKAPSAIRDLILGSIAGTINVLLTTPLWVVNMRMKMQGAKVNKFKDYDYFLDYFQTNNLHFVLIS